MLDNTFEVVWLVGFIAGCAVRAVGVLRVKRGWRGKPNAVTDDRTPRSDWPLLLLVFLGMQVIPLLYVLTPWLDFADYDLPAWAGWTAGLLGAAVFAVALWLLWRSHTDLGRNWSPTLQIREGHALVTHGVFHYIRHPMYAAHGLWAVAQVLLLRNWIAGPAFLALSLPLYLLRVPREEQMMLDHFGDEYRLYISRTGRVIPRLRKWSVTSSDGRAA